MFAAWGSAMARFRWPVLVVVLAAVAGAGVWGMGVFGQLSEGGYSDPASESARAVDLVQSIGAQAGDVVVIYTPVSGTVDDAVLGRRVENVLAALPVDKVRAATSYWRAGQATQYASADRTSAVAVLSLAGKDDGAKLAAYRGIKDQLAVKGAKSQVAGGAALGDASAARSTADLGVAEAISLPIVLLLLLFIFGSLVAAALPVLIGGCAVLGSLGVLHAVALHHDVNSFAVNVASLLGLGMAIDYGLFTVGRFREEQGFGRAPADAVRRTVATAGRTVMFSATLLMIALGGLLLFPQGFLKSLAYGGLAAVALAAVLSLTLLPAVLAVLGPRVDKIPVRLPRRRNARPAGTAWAGLARVVLRRPVLIALPIAVGLLALALPVRHVQFGENDERTLPAGDPARVAIEHLKSDYPALSSVGIQVVVRGPGGRAPDPVATTAYTAAIERVPGIAAAGPTARAGDVVVLTATLRNQDPFSADARTAVRDIRAVPRPGGCQVLVGGTTARNVDSLAATAKRLPLMIALLVGATLLLMFLAFGSVLLPIKAVVMSALSLSATFGILVWIFQDGHGAGLLRVTPAPSEVGIVVLMAAVVFGLSTDYEVFLLSRMVEARTRGATTAEAVTSGLARTGRVISAAAVLLIVVTGAFALSAVSTMRFVGIGMITALLLDATVVRMLLVPAVLGLLGDAAWWAPGPLRRLQQRAGLSEYAGEELFPTVSVGRHAAPDAAVSMSRSSAPPRHASRSETAVATPVGLVPVEHTVDVVAELDSTGRLDAPSPWLRPKKEPAAPVVEDAPVLEDVPVVEDAPAAVADAGPVVPGEKATVSLHPEPARDVDSPAIVAEDSTTPQSDRSDSSESEPAAIQATAPTAPEEPDDAVEPPAAAESGKSDDAAAEGDGPAAEIALISEQPRHSVAEEGVAFAEDNAPEPAAAPASAAALPSAAAPAPAVVPPPRSAVDDLRGPRVGLPSPVNPANADPDSTAVLEVHPTIDLASRVDRPEDSVRRH